MKIVRYRQFILEHTDTVETYSNASLSKLKRKIESMFNDEDVKSMKDNDKDKPTFKEYGMHLDDIELSTQPHDRLGFRFSDDSFYYQVYVEIKVADVTKDISEIEDGDNFSEKDIQKAYLKFKKYDMNNDEVVGQVDKNVKIEDIDEEYLINLKVEIDDDFGGEEEKFEIETE